MTFLSVIALVVIILNLPSVTRILSEIQINPGGKLTIYTTFWVKIRICVKYINRGVIIAVSPINTTRDEGLQIYIFKRIYWKIVWNIMHHCAIISYIYKFGPGDIYKLIYIESH